MSFFTKFSIVLLPFYDTGFIRFAPFFYFYADLLDKQSSFLVTKGGIFTYLGSFISVIAYSHASFPPYQYEKQRMV
jgi:hypothetical protein